MAETQPRPVVGVGAVIWHGDCLLLVKRGKPPRLGEWSLPGGRQEWGETIEAAIRREVFEETALQLEALVLIDVVDHIERSAEGKTFRHYTLVDFAGEATSSEAVAGSDAREVAWVTLPDLETIPLWSKTRDVIAQAAELRRRGQA